MLKIYNSLTKTIEEFKPINPPYVRMYSCGPTVYDYQHIGNMRRYVGDDVLIRVLKFNGFKVKQVMNITDVGNLTSDSDTGEDKMEKGARKFGMSVWEVAKKFEGLFLNSIDVLNISRPDILMHATDFIKEQIAFIQILEKKGFTYKIEDGVYFDTSKVKNYAKLSGQRPEELKAGARIEMVKGKKNPTDFALWKFSYSFGRVFDPNKDDVRLRRQMEWESPWGFGFPGWHIECSTMAIKGLQTETLDIHTGGIEHMSIHHTNEIVQSEAATGRQFVRYWVHYNHMHVDGQKMSKSLGNTYTVEDVVKNGFDPLALRYLCLQTHYRQEMNFTWEALRAAQISLERLTEEIARWGSPKIGCAKYEEEFTDAINNDLNMPKALGVMWDVVHCNYPTSSKAETLIKFDKILELDLFKSSSSKFGSKLTREEIPDYILKLIEERGKLRGKKQFEEADRIRDEIRNMGYDIQDRNRETAIRKSQRD